jgi:hypothetical protein
LEVVEQVEHFIVYLHLKVLQGVLLYFQQLHQQAVEEVEDLINLLVDLLEQDQMEDQEVEVLVKYVHQVEQEIHHQSVHLKVIMVELENHLVLFLLQEEEVVVELLLQVVLQ